jgi:hypothetical protein
MTTKPEPTRGERWAASVRADFELNQSEEALVIEASGVMDEIDALPASAVTERRHQRTLLARLLGALGLPDADAGSEARRADVSAKARRAARARWANVNGQGA